MVGQETLISVFEDFEKEAEEQIEITKKAFEVQNILSIQKELHTLKGNSGTLGASQVYEICEKIESKAKVCDFKNFEEEITSLTSALYDFEIEIVKL